MNLEEHRDDPDPISQTVLHLHHHLRVHQVVQADLHQIVRNQIGPLLHQVRVHKVDQADLAVQVAIEVIDQIDQIAVNGRVEAEVHVLEKMNNVMIAELN
jgi:hypothetical protein